MFVCAGAGLMASRQGGWDECRQARMCGAQVHTLTRTLT